VILFEFSFTPRFSEVKIWGLTSPTVLTVSVASR
jgi:hypothetical protein